MHAVKGFSKAFTVTFCPKTKSPARVRRGFVMHGKLFVRRHGLAFNKLESAVSELIEIEAGDSFYFRVC